MRSRSEPDEWDRVDETGCRSTAVELLALLRQLHPCLCCVHPCLSCDFVILCNELNFPLPILCFLELCSCRICCLETSFSVPILILLLSLRLDSIVWYVLLLMLLLLLWWEEGLCVCAGGGDFVFLCYLLGFGWSKLALLDVEKRRQQQQ
jgi:hypothetical protein